MKFLDLFAGIGGFRLGLEMAGHECVGHVEIDKYAHKSYVAMHNPKEDEYYADDIRSVKPEDLPDFDILTGGFPCQSFSIAGKRGGFTDTRGTLFFEIMRIASVRKPKYLFLENVKGLFSHDGGKTFGTILSTLWECGYDAEWQVCNSKNYGVPQNRERVFIIGHLRGAGGGQVFPVRHRSEVSDEEQVGTNPCIPALTATDYKGASQQRRHLVIPTSQGIKQIGNIDQHKTERENPQTGRIYSTEGISPTLNTMQGGQREPKISNGMRIRKLTPKECFRLQGFPDEYFERAAEVVSNSQLYKQAGNSVTVPVIYEIAKKLKEEEARR